MSLVSVLPAQLLTGAGAGVVAVVVVPPVLLLAVFLAALSALEPREPTYTETPTIRGSKRRAIMALIDVRFFLGAAGGRGAAWLRYVGGVVRAFIFVYIVY